MNKLAVDIGNSFFGGVHFLDNLGGVGSLVSILLSNAIIVAGVVFIFLVIYGGIKMVTGAGKSPQEFAQGREIISAGIIGFLIVFASYWVIRIVEASTGLNILN